MVWDLDETLANNSYDNCQRPMYYLRPYCREVMDAIKEDFDVVNVLWTMSTGDLAYDVIVRLKLATYFNKIMTRVDCERSKREFGTFKDFRYLVKTLKYQNTADITSVIVDDRVDDNVSKLKGAGFNYDVKIKPKPFDLSAALGGRDREMLRILRVFKNNIKYNI